MVAGYSLAREIIAPIPWVIAAALGLVGMSLRFAKQHRTKWLLSFIAATTLTAWAYGSMRLPPKPNTALLSLPMREAQIDFEVVRVMQARNAYGSGSGIGRVLKASPTSRLNRGTRIFFRIKLPERDTFKLLRGSKLQATGVLTPIPDEVAPDSFQAYLKEVGIHYQFNRSSNLQILAAPSLLDQFFHSTNERFQEYLHLGAPTKGNLDSIYIAMLLGRKAELTDEQLDRFRMTGTMHFFAISGLHIGVIATVIAQFLIVIRVPRKISPFIGLPLVLLYVEITGAAPSAVRAFLMALFFWLSFAFTRQRSPLAALAASAVFVLIFIPEQLWSLGFQLSYTVVLSILLFGLPLYEISSERLAPFRYLPKANWSRWQRIYSWTQDTLQLLFAISFSAWLASAPLSAAFFGYFSPGAIILNMLLVNLAALTISSGVISLSLALVGLENVAGFINHAAWLCLQAMDYLVSVSTKIPNMIITCDDFPEKIAYCGLFGYFALLFWLHHARNERATIMWLLPPVVIATSLLAGWSAT
jgi:competence protein ComEC